ncbi:MAG: lytic murein transglycosylase [Rhodospirillaceae bacterium]
MALSIGFAAGLANPQSAQAVGEQPFPVWLQGMKAEALQAGISPRIVASVLDPVQPINRVMELDSRQPEFTLAFSNYFGRAVSPDRITKGRQLLATHGALLNRISARYGVPPRFIVSFWGLETNFGGFMGDFSTIDALATLAWHGRRGAFFRAQLLDALRIIEDGHASRQSMTGSWAGAMGHVQFMPSTFRAYAVDGDGDGRINLWASLPDAFSSAASYLSAIGWKADENWGREVKLPKPGFDYGLSGLGTQMPLKEWAAKGVRAADGSPLPQVEGFPASLLLPSGANGPAFLVYENYRHILDWNRSLFYALAVGHLADRIAGAGGLLTPMPEGDRPLRTAEVMEIQQRLTALGFDVGTPDGKIGRKTREGLRAYQASRNVPADGHPNATVLAMLRQGGGSPQGSPAAPTQAPTLVPPVAPKPTPIINQPIPGPAPQAKPSKPATAATYTPNPFPADRTSD